MFVSVCQHCTCSTLTRRRGWPAYIQHRAVAYVLLARALYIRYPDPVSAQYVGPPSVTQVQPRTSIVSQRMSTRTLIFRLTFSQAG